MSAFTSPTPANLLLKETVAATLREKIVGGLIEPGQTIVEGKWATQLGVAQGSVREALNILASEGFVQKIPGRRARVTKLTRDDIQQISRVRSFLEGLAARLVVEKRADLSSIEAAYEDLRRAVASDNVQDVIQTDLRFHLSICEQSGNRFLLEHLRRLIVPLFAFVHIRVYTNQRGSQPWRATLDLHTRILDVLRLGDPFAAEQFVIRATNAFAAAGYDDWEVKLTQ